MSRRKLACLLATASLALACAATSPPGTGVGDGGTGNHTGDGTTDAGTAFDAGTCHPAPDTDGTAASGVVISEVFPDTTGFIELFVASGAPLAAATTEVLAGTRRFAVPGDLPVGGRAFLPAAGLPDTGEVVVRSAGAVVAYTCWGSLGSTSDQNAAVTAGVWASPGSCALAPPPESSIHCTGTCHFAADYVAAAPTPPACQ